MRGCFALVSLGRGSLPAVCSVATPGVVSGACNIAGKVRIKQRLVFFDSGTAIILDAVCRTQTILTMYCFQWCAQVSGVCEAASHHMHVIITFAQ